MAGEFLSPNPEAIEITEINTVEKVQARVDSFFKSVCEVDSLIKNVDPKIESIISVNLHLDIPHGFQALLVPKDDQDRQTWTWVRHKEFSEMTGRPESFSRQNPLAAMLLHSFVDYERSEPVIVLKSPERPGGYFTEARLYRDDVDEYEIVVAEKST